MFAEASGGGAVGFFIFLLIMVMGVRQWCIWLKGNDALRGAAKTGALNILSRMFKKWGSMMGFADSFSQHLCFLFLTFWLVVLLAIKLLRTVDDDGEIKKTANNGLAAWIEQRFKLK
jgi:hypothetical protein